MKEYLDVRRFEKSDYEEYKSWFQDEQLQQALGSIDEEWLDHILHVDGQTEFAVFLGEGMVAVVGVTYPISKEEYYVISNIAIKPSLRNQGLGSKVLMQLLKEAQLKKYEFWVSYVEKTNACGQAFFEKHRWSRIEEEEMIKYEYRG